MKLQTFLASVGLLLLLIVSGVIADSSKLYTTDQLQESIEYTADILQSALETHCHTYNQSAAYNLRQKRLAEEQLRLLIKGVLVECFKDDSYEAMEDPCTSVSTVSLTEPWRKEHNGARYKPENNSYACDSELQLNKIWFRFSGSAGNQLYDRCPPEYSCGGHGGLWTDAAMPTKVGEIKFVPLYGSLNGNCNWYTWSVTNPLTVKRCSTRPGDFVYKVHGTGSCWWTFCSMDSMDGIKE